MVAGAWFWLVRDCDSARGRPPTMPKPTPRPSCACASADTPCRTARQSVRRSRQRSSRRKRQNRLRRWSRRCTARGAAGGGRRHAHLQAPRRRQPRVQRDGGTDVGERRRRDVVRRTRARWLHGRQGRAVTRQPSAVSPARVRQASCHIMSIIFYTDTEKSVYVCACVIRADSVSTCQNSSSQPSSPSESYSSESPNPYPSSSLQSSSSS